MDSPEGEWEKEGQGAEEGASISPFSRAQEQASDWGNKMQEKANKREGSKDLAKLAENGAAKSGISDSAKNNHSEFMSAVQNARDAEGKTGFANNVQGKTFEQVAAGAVPGGKMIVNQAKKLGPLGVILMVVMILVGIFAGTQSLAPFGLIANGLDQFNNLRTSMNKRTTYFNRFMLNRNRNNAITKASIFGTEKFNIKTGLKNKLKKNNIYFVDEPGYGARFLVYQDETTGKKYAVAANDNDVGKLPDSVEIEIDGQKTTVDINQKMKIDDAMIDSVEFSNSLDRGTRTLKGHIAGWFDELSNNLHLRFGSSRNKFKDASDTADDEEIKNRAQNTDKMMDDDIKASKKTGDDAEETKAKEPIRDENGKIVDYELVDTSAEGDGVSRSTDRAANKTAATNAFNAKVKAIVSATHSTVDAGCAVMKTYAAINALIAAIHVANVINYVTGFFEAIQRTQIGDAGKNELSYYMTGLSTKGNTYEVDGETPIRENTSSLESPAWNQFFSDGSVILANDDKVAEKFNREYAAQQSLLQSDSIIAKIAGEADVITGGFANSIEAYKGCLTSQMVAAGTELAFDIALAFIPGGSVAKQAAKTFWQTLWDEFIGEIWTTVALSAVIGAIIGAMMTTVIPHVANALAINLIENMTGEDAAYAINSGFNIYSGSQFQLSSGLPATKEKLMAQYRAQQEVIASEAAYERSQRSPFDVTSKYTFLGSIVNSLMPIANTYSSPLSTVSKTMSTVGSAVNGLLPTAKADGEVVFETSLNEECPNLSQIGVVGDAFCNPYIATDMNTMAENPDEVMKKVDDHDSNNFNWDTVDQFDGNPEINENSTLGKWVIACAARESQFGTIDSNVMSAIALVNTGNSVLDAAIEGGVGALPFVGSAKDIMDAASEEKNLPWASGENCVNEEYAYYSRYSEDQRLMESAGIIDESQVARFLDKYYEENPLDNSYEGILARYSGMTKNEVEETLAVVDYFNFIADYDPTTYGPMKYEPTKEKIQFEEDEVIASEDTIINKYIVYDDLRNKVKIA